MKHLLLSAILVLGLGLITGCNQSAVDKTISKAERERIVIVAKRPVEDLADSCLVRMTELAAQSKVWTVDRRDFSVYRRHGRQIVPCEFPPRKRRG